jgi:cytochrome c peroxidase
MRPSSSYHRIDGSTYSRVVRRGARFHEDEDLQDLLINKGLDALRQFACQSCHGFSVGVGVEQRQRMGTENRALTVRKPFCPQSARMA